MKHEAKCPVCGKHIFVHDYATTDICPECMSFIEVEKAKAALQAEQNENSPAEPAQAAESAAVKTESAESAAEESAKPTIEPPAEEAEPFEQEDTKAFVEAEPAESEEEEPREDADWDEDDGSDGAAWGEKWKRVLENTDQLKDFSKFDDVRGDAEELIEELTVPERDRLFECYADRLDTTCANLKTKLGVKDEKGKSLKWLWVAAIVIFVAIFVQIIATDWNDMGKSGALALVAVMGCLVILFAFVFVIVIAVTRRRAENAAKKDPFGYGQGETESPLSDEEREALEQQLDDAEWLYEELNGLGE